MNAQLRREYVLQLRVQGATFRQIAAQVRVKAPKEGWTLPKKYDERQACQDLRRHLRQMARPNEEDILVQLRLAEERYNRLLTAIWPEALRGKASHVAQAASLVQKAADLYKVRRLAELAFEGRSTAPRPVQEDRSGRKGEAKMLSFLKRLFHR